ncbi:MAG: TonB-dependent receptor family protein [Persicimonas sp.]
MRALQFIGLLAISSSLVGLPNIVSAQQESAQDDDEVIIVVPEEGDESGDSQSGEREPDDAQPADEAAEEGDEDSDSEEDEDAVRLEAVEVQAERMRNVGGVAHELDEEELERLEYDDPHDILLQVPGVYVRTEDGFGLRPNIGMRGANSERSKKVTLMEDGILFGPAPYSAPAAYYFPIVNRMVGVDIFKGPASVQYGPQTIGGAINWHTREIPEASTGSIDVNAGSYLTGKAHGHYGWGTDWGGFLLEGVHWQSDGFKELDGGGDTGFNRQEFMAKGRLNTDRDASTVHSLTAKLGYSREHSNETYLGLTDEDFADNPLRRYAASQLDEMDWDRTQAQLRYQLDVEKSFNLDVAAYRHDFQRTWFKLNGFRDPTPLEDVLATPDSGRRAVLYDVLTGQQDSTAEGETLLLGANAREFVSQGVQTVAQHRTHGDNWYNQLEMGVRLHHDQIERDHTEDQFLMRSGELVEADAATATTTQNRGETLALAAHILDELYAYDFTLTPGLRAELISTDFVDLQQDESTDNTQTVLIPGFGAHYAITPEFGVLAGVHRGFSPVSPGQPNEVEPETSVNYEAGLRYSDERTATLLEAIGFFNDYSNLIGECSFSAGCGEELLDRQFNAGEVYVWGAEVVAAHTFALGGDWFLPGRLAYTLTQSEFQTSFDSANPQFGDVEQGDELPYVPEHQASLELGVTDGSFALNTRLTYVSEMREEAGQDDPSQGDQARMTEAYGKVDLLASYGFLDGFEAYAKASNLLNTQAIASRRPFGARPTNPLMARLGLKCSF